MPLKQTLLNAVHGYIVIRPSDNQPFDGTTFVLETLTVHGNELRLLRAMASPLI